MPENRSSESFPAWHGTTIIGVRKGGKVVIAGDGQVSLGQTVIKGSARKVRRLSPGGHEIVAGSRARPPTHSRCLSGWRPSSRRPRASFSGLAWNWPRTGGPTSTCKSLRRC